MRLDHDAIQAWIKPNSRVLDLGCGDGALLLSLKNNKQVRGVGIEIDHEKFNQCVAKGLNVIEQNADLGLGNFADNTFDIVVMSQTLQAMNRPDQVLDETLRSGKEAIVAFPNFGHWFCRLHLGFKGKMPVSRTMPYSWFDTPNIHFCTVADFERLCETHNIQILNRVVTTADGKFNRLAALWANLFASTAI